MNEYEVFVQSTTPCGGEAHSEKELLEIEAESPEAYIRAHGRWPLLETIDGPNGDRTFVTGNGKGYFVKYTFTA